LPSHAWTDNATWKRTELIEFSETFKKEHGRYPTFWFDKLCIDQSNPGNGIATLPINIGACKSMLVLMGPEYIKRLWCVWELFTLFTFANKELALERIKIIPHSDVDVEKSINGFDIDQAHSFDPNEEVKLRHLMINVVGTKNLVQSLKSLKLEQKPNLPPAEQTHMPNPPAHADNATIHLETIYPTDDPADK
jgi:hypothetical protein